MHSVPLFGGQHGVVFFGPRSDQRRYRYWAERGLIHMEDSSDNSYETLTVREFLTRVKGINDMVGNSVKDLDGFAHSDELARQQKFIDEAVVLANKAKEQGMPPRLGVGKMQHQRFSALVNPSAYSF